MPAHPAISSDSSGSATASGSASWTTTLAAASSSVAACLPCLRRIPSDDSFHNHRDGGQTVSRPPIRLGGDDELRGLLADADAGDDGVSLHSNFGPGTSARRQRKKKLATKKNITLFGFDLFGSRAGKTPKIYLGDEDTDALYHDGAESARGSGSRASGSGRSRAGSLGQVDSDAEPLSRSVIDSMGLDSPHPPTPPGLGPSDLPPSPPTYNPLPRPSRHGSVASEAAKSPDPSADDEAKRLAKEKRREQRRAERRALRTLERLKAQGILPEDKGGEEFEGFQGSGGLAPPLPSPSISALKKSRRSKSSVTTSTGTTSTGTDSRTSAALVGGPTRHRSRSVAQHGSHHEEEEFGDFVDVKRRDAPPAPVEDEDEVDLDGSLYAAKSRRGAYRPGAGGSQSESRSNGSGHKRGISSSTGSSANRPPPSPLGLVGGTGAGGSNASGSAPGTPIMDSGDVPSETPKKKSKSKRRGSVSQHAPSVLGSISVSGRTGTSSRTSQSLSLASPRSEGFGPEISVGIREQLGSPSAGHVEQGIGFFDDDEVHVPKISVPGPFVKRQEGFPSTGFGRKRGDSRTSTAGAQAAKVFGALGDGL